MGLLEHVQSEVLKALLPPPGQELHEGVDDAILEENMSIAGTLNRELAEMKISHCRLISILQGLSIKTLESAINLSSYTSSK